MNALQSCTEQFKIVQASYFPKNMANRRPPAPFRPYPPSRYFVHLDAPRLEIIPSTGAQPPEIIPIDRFVHDVVGSWQARKWRASKECQHLVRVLVELKRSVLKRSPICPVFAEHVPPFLMSGTHEVFFELARMYDHDLRESVVTSLAKWPYHLERNKTTRLSVYRDIRTDPDVHAAAARLLPEGVCLREWIERRMYEEMELVDRGGIEDEWIVRLTPEGCRRVSAMREYLVKQMKTADES